MLPAFLYWLPATDPAPNQTITPGPKEPVRAVLAPVEPGLQAPNAEAAAGSVSLARSESKPNVPVPPSTSVPVALPISLDLPQEHTEGGSVGGAAVAAVSISPRLPGKDETVSLPRVSAVGGGSAGAESNKTDVRGSEIADGAAAGASSGPPANYGPGHDGAEAVVRTIDTRSGRLEMREFPDGSQHIQYPKDGRFDAILIQATGGDLVPETRDLLTGRPVQTVYLAVGTGREWVLQYCLPHVDETPATQSGMVVSLGGRPKLQAPWIRFAALPPRRNPSFKSSVFFGTLQADGRFHNMRALLGSKYQPRPELLAYLEQWEFRPAQRDGAAAEIEVVLIVPVDAAL